MPIPAGTMNQRVQFLRRAAGAFAPLGPAQWARLRYERSATVTIASVPLQGRSGQITVRDCDLTRGLTVGDRVEFDGETFSITMRKAREVDSDDIHLEIESAPSSALYAAEMDRRGEVVSLERGPARANVRAIVTGFAADELIGDIDQGTRQVWLLAADIESAGWPAPPVKNDKIRVRGNVLNIMTVDADTHRSAGALNAYYVTAKGA